MPLKTWIGWQGAVSAGVAIVLAAGFWLSLGRALEDEAEKARFLKGEIAKLDREIAEVRHLKEAIQSILARKQIVEVLQADRYAVQLLEELARTRPQGVVLAAVREERGLFFVTAAASSERQAGAFLENLKASSFFEGAQLVELRTPARFTVSMALKGRRLPASSGPARIPADVHPGDPK